MCSTHHEGQKHTQVTRTFISEDEEDQHIGLDLQEIKASNKHKLQMSRLLLSPR